MNDDFVCDSASIPDDEKLRKQLQKQAQKQAEKQAKKERQNSELPNQD